MIGIELDYSPYFMCLSIPIYLIFFFYFRKKKLNFLYDIIFVLFIIYLINVSAVTFFPIPINNAEIENWRISRENWPILNLIPFRETYEFINLLAKDFSFTILYQALIQIIGNIVLFVPFGFLLPLLKRHALSLKKLVLISSCFSLFIELGQLFLSLLLKTCFRYADIDDIISNIAGALFGYCLLKICNKLLYRKFNLNYIEIFNSKSATLQK